MECALFRKDYDFLIFQRAWYLAFTNFMECALFRKDYDIGSSIEVLAKSTIFMECALFRKDYDPMCIFFDRRRFL